ncbi:MAG: 50S ribosomal protein L9 [candidate division WOR-3 bacterium]
MKVILLSDVDRLGSKGEIVNVKPGFARNYLLPKKLALIATQSNLKYFNELKKRAEVKEQKRTEAAKLLATKLATVSLKADLPIGEAGAFGAITNHQIADLLKQAGYEIDKHSIVLDQPINEPGIYDISIKLAPQVTTTIKLWVGGKKSD